MVMEQYWHLYRIRFRIPVERFDKEALANDIKDNAPQDPYLWGWSFGSTTEPGKQHADMMVDFRRNKYVRVTITYHRTDFEVEDHRPPYMEDCARWLSAFVKEASVPVDLDVSYVFGSGYSSVVSLPFPLLAVLPDREFENASITGLAIRLSNEQRVSIDRENESIFFRVNMKDTFNLAEFQLEEGLERLSFIVKKLIKKTEVDEQ